MLERNLIHTVFIFLLAVIFGACNVTKYVPEGEYILDEVRVKSDNKDLKPENMYEYLRQTPNNAILGIKSLRMALGIYNLRGVDTTSSWNRMLIRMGEPPVIFSPTHTAISAQQIEKYAQSKGYLLARVETKITKNNKKSKVEYHVLSNTPYTIRSFQVELPLDTLKLFQSDTTRSLILPNSLFDTDVLFSERERISSRLRRRGCYHFNKDLMNYSVDSSLNSHQVDVKLHLIDNIINSDSLYKHTFKRYKIKQLIYHVSTSSMNSIDSIKNMRYDTIRFQNYLLISPIDHPLKIDALISNTYLQPNTLFNDRSVEKTYEALNSIGSIKYVNIGFSELNDSLLNCHINVVLSKFIQVAYEAGATYSSTTATSTRAIGGAANISFVHRNAFKGSESLSLNLKASAEHMDIWAQEFGGQLGLKIPKFIFPVGKSDFKHSLHANTELSFGYKYQFRPKQFETTIMNGGVQYTWNDRFYKHSFQLINLNYIYYPHIDSYFRRLYLEPTVNTVTQKVEPSKFNPASFDNILIMSLGYFGTFSNAVASRPLQSYTTARYSFESAGSSIYGISKLFGLPQESNGVYRLLGVQYSQYLKGEYNITHHSIFDKNNRLVYHVGLGFMVPFANSDIVPYQKRFYSGGANSIRGWSEGTLGPGSYRRYQISGRDFNQVGDVKLELNIEYRTKIYRWFEGALFVDAGNVWTVKEYENQKDGAFHFNSFANQIAVAYGLGLRMDFSFFIFRMDMGVKLRDPVQEVQNRWRLEPTLMQDVALQIAIGYPF